MDGETNTPDTRGQRRRRSSRRHQPSAGRRASQSDHQEAKKHWWRSLPAEEVCPISLEPICEFPQPPFTLYNYAQHTCERGQSTRFDGRILAHYLVSTGKFEHPVSRRELTLSECRMLDQHMKEHKLGVGRVSEAFDRRSEYHKDSDGNLGLLGLQAEADALLQVFFANAPERTNRARNSARRLIPASRSRAHHQAAAVVASATVQQEEGMLVVVDDDQQERPAQITDEAAAATTAAAAEAAAAAAFPGLPGSPPKPTASLAAAGWNPKRGAGGAAGHFALVANDCSSFPCLGGQRVGDGSTRRQQQNVCWAGGSKARGPLTSKRQPLTLVAAMRTHASTAAAS